METENIEQNGQEVGRSPLREIGRDILWYIPAKAIPALAGFLGLVAYTRLLSPEQYGFYVLAVTIITIVTSMGFSWLNNASLRYLRIYQEKAILSEFISTTTFSLMIFFIPISTIWYIFTIIFEPYLSGDLLYLLRVGVLVLGCKAGFAFIISIFRAEREVKKYAWYTSINSLGTIVIAVCLLYFFNLGPEAIFWGMIVISGGALVNGISHFHTKWKVSLSAFSLATLKSFARYGLPLMGVALGALLLSYSDRYMLQYFSGPGQVAIYSAGYDLADKAIKILFSILISTAYPVLIQTFEQRDKFQTRLLLERLLGIYFLVVIPAALGLVALSSDVVSTILGREFQNANLVIPWVTGGVFFLGLSQLIVKPFELEKKTVPLLYLLMGSVIFNILLNFVLIPKLGARGAAISTFISYAVYCIGVWLSSRHLLIFSFPWLPFCKATVASVLMYFLLAFLSFSVPFALILLIKISLGFSVYLILLIFLKERNIIKLLRHFTIYIALI